jgi:hypothetical protein
MLNQHEATAEVVKAVSTSDIKWSLLCVCRMQEAHPNQKVFDLLQAPRHHDLTIQSSVLPDWKWGWVSKLPYIGEVFKRFEVFWIVVFQYHALLEDVADLVAESLEIGGETGVGMEVGYKQKKVKST